jgi:hypothetical protein
VVTRRGFLGRIGAAGVAAAAAGIAGRARAAAAATERQAMAISDWAELMCRRETTVQDLAARLGRPLEKQAGAGYRFAPLDQRILGMWLGIDVRDGIETPRYLEVRFQPSAAPALADVQREFGTPKVLPAAPEGDPYIVRFRYDRKEHPYIGFVFAGLSAPPDDPAARVLRLTIRREERL